MDDLARAFCLPYVGDADIRFHQYVMRCCKNYYTDPSAYVAPYATLVQSSGFGKSRILYQIAKNIGSIELENDMFDTRLLYVCARNVEYSTGFPAATPSLSNFFFGNNNISSRRLQAALDYACANWETVKNDWLGLFGAAFIIGANTEKTQPTDIDFGLTINLLKSMRVPSENAQGSSELVNEDERIKVLVLAVDEARHLLEKEDINGVNYFCLLRRALVDVNVQRKTRKTMIFAVFVDTNPRICDLEPSLSTGLTSTHRTNTKKDKKLFPPFVLTHTMDVMLNMGQSHPFDYKKSVLQHDPDTTWNTLVSMGRPMWHSYVMTKPWNRRGIFILAASKLLCGLSPFNKESYGESSLQGVASLMCRLGLRPQSHSAFATQAVSDFMAVLHYVNCTYDAHISGYVTEPVLTFGATHLWYEIDPLPLEEYILPQFLELLMQGLIDVGSIGEVVARIILLLAMDATSMGEDGFRAYRLSGTGSKRFKGQFCSVKQFLGLLDGSLKPRAGIKCDNVPNDATEKDNNAKPRRELFNVIDEENATTGAATPEQRDSFELWMNDWGNWCIGFNHFVELTDLPTTATLWCLLGRRAAGVFPRDHEEAQLVIPVFCKDTAEVSFILVKVWNEETTDWEFPQSALRNLSPASVFAVNEEEESKHEFSELSPRRIIRIYMSLRECNISIPAQSYLIDNASATSVDNVSYTLCLRGMCCPPRLGSVSSLRNWPFLLTLKIADQLARLAASAWWDPLAKVNVDMARRRFFKELIPDEELKEAVGCTLKIPGDGGRGDF